MWHLRDFLSQILFCMQGKFHLDNVSLAELGMSWYPPVLVSLRQSASRVSVF